MFYWFAAIPFFLVFALISLISLPYQNLHKIEDSQTLALAFRMAVQHDAAVKYTAENLTTDTKLENGYIFRCAGINCPLQPYLPAHFKPDFGNVRTYTICSAEKCSAAARVSIVTVADEDMALKWIGTYDSYILAQSLEKYIGSFPMWRSLGEPPYYTQFALRGNPPLTLVGRIFAGKLNPEEISMEKKIDERIPLAVEIRPFVVAGDAAIVTTVNVIPSETEDMPTTCKGVITTAENIVPIDPDYGESTSPWAIPSWVWDGLYTGEEVPFQDEVMTVPCTGKFDITVAGGGASYAVGGPAGSGGAVKIKDVQLIEGSSLKIRLIAGGHTQGDPDRPLCSGPAQSWAGFGTAVYRDDELLAVAGGSGFPSFGGGGYVGGKGLNGYNSACDGDIGINGFSIDGTRGSSTSYGNGDGFHNAPANWTDGGDEFESYGSGYGGKSYCNTSAGNCTYQKGGYCGIGGSSSGSILSDSCDSNPVVSLKWTGK